MDCIGQGKEVVSSELNGAAWKPRLAQVNVAKNQDIHNNNNNTIQSYFYFRYINANDNLLYLLSTASIISYHLVIIENCFIFKWKRRKFWEKRWWFFLKAPSSDWFPNHFRSTQSSMSLEWKAKINLWRKAGGVLIKLCLNLLMGHSHEFLGSGCDRTRNWNSNQSVEYFFPAEQRRTTWIKRLASRTKT